MAAWPERTKQIAMILPVPVPPQALSAFAAQVPERLRRPDIEIRFIAPRSGGSTLDSYYEMTLADAFVLDAGVKAAADGADAICINSMSDSGLAALRSRLDIPVIGPCQATFLTACMMGNRFSVVTMWDRWKVLYTKCARDQGLDHRMASIRAIDVRPDTAELLAGKEDIVFPKLEAAARRCIEEDGADVIILGSTTMHQSHAYLAERLPVPVLNPGLISLKVCEMWLDLELRHSAAAYAKPERPVDDILSGVPPVFP